MGFKIWERYFLKEILKVFFLFLGCFYGLYVLIDYASHTSALPQHHVQIQGKELAKYYLFIFASRAEILIPVAFLVATIKTLCQLNVHHELVALMAGGIKQKALLRPFLFLAFLLTAILFLNEQTLLPPALRKLRRIEDSTKHQKNRNQLSLAVRNLTLEDGSIFIFQSYDTAQEHFFDAYWIRSIDNIYRIKYLKPHQSHPIGYFVDHFIRQPNGVLSQVESFEQLTLKGLNFNHELLQSATIDPDALSLSELWTQLPGLQVDEFNEKESKILTAFYWKLLMPWLSLLAILAVAPFCLVFSRQLPVFFIYVCGIFGILAFYLIMDAAQIIAKKQVVAPQVMMGVPFLISLMIFGWRFYKKLS